MDFFKTMIDLTGCTFALITATLVSAQEFRSQSTFSNLRNAALSVDRGEVLESYGWNAALSATVLLVEYKNCDSVNINSGLRVLLKDLDRSIISRSDQITTQYKVVRSYLSHALHCSPADGNIWIRYALVENALSTNPEKIASMAAMSDMLSPSNKGGAIARSELIRNSRGGLNLLLERVR